jgi:thioredoxin reductase (NADPH)
MTPSIETEALVIGAGPVGLFQVFQLGLQGIHCHVIDSLPHAGGQCAELYPTKPIYDIPCLHLGQHISAMERQADQGLIVHTDTGQAFLTRTLFIAAGVGAFVPRRLVLDGLDVFESRQVFVEHPVPEHWANQRLVVVGDGDTALQTCLAAIQGAQAAASVTLLHLRDQFTAAPELIADMRQACAL